MKYSHYSQLAELFDFPEIGFKTRGEVALKALEDGGYTEAVAETRLFLDGFPKQVVDQQEIFTRTFDVQAITTLDVGYVMFGDDYKRAELLSNLTREHARLGTNCKGELGDNLPNILRLIPTLIKADGGEESEELLNELVSEILVPALMLMIREFNPERVERKNTYYQKHFKTLIDTASDVEPTIYRRALSALLSVLKQDFEVTKMLEQIESWSNKPQTADFLGLVAKEMEIEDNANPTNSGCDS